jgi:hypothetical protein
MMLTKSKNLIYFTLFNNLEYLSMLKLCLNTIFKNCIEPEFDMLFITEKVFVEEILNITKEFKGKVYFNTDYTAEDSIKASMNKLKIYNFANIQDYEKVLFLDCDIFIMKNLNSVFEEKWIAEKLCVFNNPEVPVYSYNSKFHGLNTVSDGKLAELYYEGILPFNAGHFAFVNTPRMKKHFNNVIWLTENWPGEYFYEQSFMNHYFALNKIVDYTILKEKILLVNLLKSLVDYKSFCDKFIVHFIGEAISPEKKLKKIQEYYNATFPLL